MADIQFRVQTDWQEVEKLVKEIDKLQTTISGVNTDLPRAEIDKLTNKLVALKEKYEEITKFASMANADLSGLFSKGGGIGSPTKELAKGVAEDMQKMQSSVTEVLGVIQGKVEEFKKIVADAFSFTANIKLNDNASGVIESMSSKLSQLRGEMEKQDTLASRQSTQEQAIIQQQQQENISLSSQGQQIQQIIDGNEERIDIENEARETIEKGTDVIKEQTDAIKEKNDALKDGVVPVESEVYDTSSPSSEKEKLLIEKIKEYTEKLANTPVGSEEYQRISNIINGYQEQLNAIENEEDNINEKIAQENAQRQESLRLAQEEKDSYDAVIKKQQEGTLSEQERLDTIEKINSGIKEGSEKISEYVEELNKLAATDTKYNEYGEVVNTAEVEAAIQKGNELQQNIENETQRVNNLKNALSALGDVKIDDSGITSVEEKAKKAYEIFHAKDTEGNRFPVMAKSAEEALEKVLRTKDSLEAFPAIIERIKKKAEEMRTNAYMTDEGEGLVKEAQNIGKSLRGKTVAQSFGANGENVGLQSVNRLSDIEQKLEAIHQREKEIEAENERIRDAEEEAQRLREEHAQSAMRLRTQLMNAREEMARMIAEGKQGTPEFQAMAQETGKMREQMQLASAALNYYSDPQRSLTTLKVGLQGVAGAAGLVTSVMGLFNEDSKKMLEIQTKIQSVLGIVVGLETTYNLVKKESFIRLAAEEVITWAVTKARGAQTIATTAATTAQEGLNIAMMKNPYGAIIALLVTLAAAIYGVVKALTSETEEEKKAKEERQRAIEAAKKQQEAWVNSVAENVTNQLSLYRKLQRQWKALGSDQQKQKKFIKENEDAFHKLGYAVGSVTDAENLLVNNTDAVVKSIMARARAIAYQELVTEDLKKQIQEQLNADKANDSVAGGRHRYKASVGQDASTGSKDVYAAAKRAGYKYQKGDIDENGNWTKQGAKRINEYSNKDAANKRKEAAKRDAERNKKHAETQKKIQELADKDTQLAEDAAKSTGVPTYNGKENRQGNGGSGGSDDRAKIQAERIAEENKFQDELEDLQKKAARAREDAALMAINNQYLREKKQRELQHKRTLEDLQAQEDEIYKKIYESRKREYERTHEGEYENTAEGARGWRGIAEDQKSVESAKEEIKKYISFLGTSNAEVQNAIESLQDKTIFNGNADIVARPFVDAADLALKGWKDVGEGIATAYSVQNNFTDSKGGEHKILYTPILPDGSVLSPKELEEYISGIVKGSQSAEEILAKDTNGLIVSVDIKPEMGDLGEKLHELYDQIYNGLSDEDKGKIDATFNKIRNGIRLSTDELKIYKANKDIIDAKTEEENNKELQRIREIAKKRDQSLNAYYEKYGSEEEKRAAIIKRNEEEINAAREEGDMGRLLTAQAKMAEDLKQFDAETIKQNLNWDAIFSDISNYDLQFLTTLEGQLEIAMKQGIEKGINAADLKVLGDKLQQVRDTLADRKTGILSTGRLLGGSWLGNVTQQRSAQQRREERAADAQAVAKAALLNVGKKQKDKDAANLGYQQALETFGKGSPQAEKAFERLTKSSEELEKAQQEEKQASGEAVQAQAAAAQGAKTSALAITDAIIHGVNDNLQSANTMFQEWGIGSEEFREKFAMFADSSAKATQAFDSLKQGDAFGVVYNLGEAVSSLGESFGLWSNSNVAEKEAEIEARENANKELVKALQDLTDAFKNSDLTNGIKTYEKALSVLNSQILNANANVRAKMDEYDGHHSTRYYSDDATHTLENLAYRAAQRGVISKDHRFSGNENINWIINEFTPEELAKLRTFDTDEWNKAMQQLRDADHAGLGATESFVAYVDEYATAVKDLERQWKETVTNLSWDSLKSSFSSALNDMGKELKDWNNDIDDILRNNVSNFISSQYTSTDETSGQEVGKLTKWYDKLAEYTESAGIDEREAAELREEYLAIQEEAAAKRDEWFEKLDLDDVSSSEAQGTINGIKSISDDTANEIVGRLTAMQISVERGNIQREQSGVNITLLNAKIDQLQTTETEARNIADDTRDILAGMAIHVEEIRDGVLDSLVPGIRRMNTTLNDIKTALS